MTARTRGGRRRTKPQHGTESEYRRGCRCDLCKSAMTAARRARGERQARVKDLEQVHRELTQLQHTAVVAGAVADVPRETFEAYVQARTERDEAERSYLRAELELKRAIGDAEIIRVGRRRIGTWAMHQRRFFDSAAFRKRHPQLWDRFQRDGEHRRFVISMFAATPPARRARATLKGVRR